MATINWAPRNMTHTCTLLTSTYDETCLPLLPPQSSRFKQWFHKLRRHFIVSKKNWRSTFVFRSAFAIKAERRRQIKRYPWYIIHPFSNFCGIFEIIMALTWSFALIKDPLAISVLHHESNKLTPWQMVDLCLDFIQMFHVGQCFITGYFKRETKEVVLSPKRVVINYLKTYFIVDFFGSLPLAFMYSKAFGVDAIGISAIILGSCKLLRFFRIRTMSYYFRTITNKLKLSEEAHILFMLLLIMVYVLHWLACAFILVPRIYLSLYLKVNKNSWLSRTRDRNSAPTIYVQSFNIIMRHFYAAGPVQIEDFVERCVLMFATITGLLYLCVALSVVLISVSIRGASESKYEEMLHQLMEFCKQKKITLELRKRVKTYFENRFQNHFFHEDEIMNSISVHMKYQIILHSCKYVLENVSLFKGLSKTALGTIVGSLKMEVYLTGDLVMHCRSHEQAVYFIAFGTLALYNYDNFEFMHVNDGDVCGAILLLHPDQNIIQYAIAVETTEVYRIDKEDFMYCMRHFADFNKKVKQMIKSAIELQEHLERQIKEAKLKKTDIVFDLRKGKIIERNKLRRRDIALV